MVRSPDLRIEARRPNLPGSCIRRAQWWVHVAPKTAPLPAYSGGTVWDLHPLPFRSGSAKLTLRYSIPNPKTNVRRPVPSPGR